MKDLIQRLIDAWAGLEQRFKMSLTIGAGVSITFIQPQEDIMNIHYDKG